jgi:hypothetical protein
MKNPRFSGHETFHCKSFWLKKGYDFSLSNSSFRDLDAVVQLGVGKNMVSSISHWMSAFNIVDDEGSFSQLGSAILDNQGFDPFIEDLGTIWFLHFQLLKKEYASLYPLFFKDFRRTRISGEFSAAQLADFTINLLKRNGLNISPNTINNDINVLLKNYVRPVKSTIKTQEDDANVLLSELNLVFVTDERASKSADYIFNYSDQPSLPPLILLAAILEVFKDRSSISINEIQNEVSDLFLCNREGTESKLQILAELGLLIAKSNAGRNEVQFKKRLDTLIILNMYYGKAN